MIQTFISVFYSNAIGRNMRVVSEKLLCRFYALKRKIKQRNSSRISKYIFKCEIEYHAISTCSFLKNQFHMKFIVLKWTQQAIF
jgi:hypothetical protein